MDKKIRFVALAVLFLTSVRPAEAQQPKTVARVGLLSGGADPAKPVLCSKGSKKWLGKLDEIPTRLN